MSKEFEKVLLHNDPVGSVSRAKAFIKKTPSLFHLFRDEKLNFTTVELRDGLLKVYDTFKGISDEFISQEEYALFEKEELEEDPIDELLCRIDMWVGELYPCDVTEKTLRSLFDDVKELYVAEYEDFHDLVLNFLESASNGERAMFLWL